MIPAIFVWTVVSVLAVTKIVKLKAENFKLKAENERLKSALNRKG